MPKLPVVKPKELFKVIQKSGFTLDHVTGSHYVFYNEDQSLRVVIPFHNKPLKRGTLTSILKQANITLEELRKLL